METTANLPDYREPDLGRAAYLVVKGYPLARLESCGRGRYLFCFAAEAEQAAAGYLAGDAVLAKALIEAEKRLKDLLYAEKFRNGDGKNAPNPHRSSP